MTTEAMTDAELNEFVTRWCEEPLSEQPTDDPDISPQGFWCAAYEGKWYPRYDFATDRNACALFEALLEERNVAEKYEDALISVIEEHNAGEDVSEEERQGISLFDGATATARDRCEALVRMVGGGDG